MTHDFTQYFPRRPRFSAVANDRFWAAVKRRQGEETIVLPAELRDFSRGGFSLYVETALEQGESISLELFDEASGFEASVQGTVRWQIRADQQRWLLGCQADEDVDWTTLGELLLSKVLVPDHDAQPAAVTPEG